VVSIALDRSALLLAAAPRSSPTTGRSSLRAHYGSLFPAAYGLALGDAYILSNLSRGQALQVRPAQWLPSHHHDKVKELMAEQDEIEAAAAAFRRKPDDGDSRVNAMIA
jgi:hypothetical protein